MAAVFRSGYFSLTLSVSYFAFAATIKPSATPLVAHAAARVECGVHHHVVDKIISNAVDGLARRVPRLLALADDPLDLLDRLNEAVWAGVHQSDRFTHVGRDSQAEARIDMVLSRKAHSPAQQSKNG